MTRDDIIRMAKEAIIRMAKEAGFEEEYGNHLFPPGDYREEVIPVTDEIIRFAALVAAAEREACAKVCESEAAKLSQSRDALAIGICAAAIRARGGMNCPLCLGQLWLSDERGDYFRCGECNGTGEKYARASIIDFESARRLRDNRRRDEVGEDDKGPDAA